MLRILNLTQHVATDDQVAAGVVEPADKATIARLLTFEEMPEQEELWTRACALASIAKAADIKVVMAGGAPFFMFTLEVALKARGIKAIYAFSRRESVEEKTPDGGVKKTQVFRHAGWVDPTGGSRISNPCGLICRSHNLHL